MGHLPHIHLIYKKDAVVDPGSGKLGLSQELPAALALPVREPASQPGLLFPPEAAILGCSPTRDDLGDENGWVVTNVRVVSATCDAEAQT